MLGDLSGRTALVTGGGRGIWRGIAIVMAEQGANIALADLATEEAEVVAAEVRAMGGTPS